jgi:hypothetical protein
MASSSYPLTPYHQHNSSNDYDYNPFSTSPPKESIQPYRDTDEGFDPYYTTPPAPGKPWGETAFANSATDSSDHRYNPKELGKWLEWLRGIH